MTFLCFSKVDYHNFESQKVPEIKRIPLDQCILKLLALGVSNPVLFDYMDRPDTEAIRQSLNTLEFLEAVTKREEGVDEYALTDLGKLMSVFPMDPRLSKVSVLISLNTINTMVLPQHFSCLS